MMILIGLKIGRKKTGYLVVLISGYKTRHGILSHNGSAVGGCCLTIALHITHL